MRAVIRQTDTALRQHPQTANDGPKFQLSRLLQRHSLSKAYSRNGFVQIPSVLRQKDAQALYSCLTERTEWGILLGSGPGIGQQYASPEQCKTFTDTQYQTLYGLAYAFRHRPGSHIAGARLIGHNAFDRASDPSLLARFADWLNTAAFLDFVGDVTGVRTLEQARVQATRLTSGHFYSSHTDAEDPQSVTCVFSLAPHWQRSWGGLLRFGSQHRTLREGLSPQFNSAVVFSSSLRHAVSTVTRQAAAPRYSIAAALFSAQERP
jgi:hypothetical protein